MYRKTYEIQFHETDCKNRLKEAVLLNFFQDIAAVDAEIMGIGYSQIQNKNIGWFLTKYHIKIFDTIKNCGKITLESQSNGIMRITFIRDFDIFDADNKKIGEATSSWAVADLETGKIVMPAEVFSGFPNVNRDELRSTFPKIPALKKVDFQKEFVAEYNNLDVNCHVNNAVYLTWADEILPFDMLVSTRISELEIQYKKQVKYGEKVIVSADFDEETMTLVEEIKLESGETACLIRQKRVNAE